MRLHTRLPAPDVVMVLRRAEDKGLIARDVRFAVFAPGRSLTHPRGYEIQLGASRQDSLPGNWSPSSGTPPS